MANIILDKKTVKEIPVGAKIHVSGKDLDIKGEVTRNDEYGLGIECFDKRKVGLSRICFIGLYSFEIL